MSVRLLSALFFGRLAIFGICEDAPASCEAAACKTRESLADLADDEEQGLKMLQMKGKRVQQPEGPPNCELPPAPQELPAGKSCPFAGQHEGLYGVSCLNGNTPYWTLSAAWSACSKDPECQVILATADGKYFLRRMSDPDMSQEEPSRAFFFSCAERDMYFQKKNRDKEAAARAAQESVDQEYKTKCPMPANPNMMPFGKNCPDDGDDGLYGATCLNGNKPYWNQNAAWVACAEVEGCGAIMQTADGRFFLRRTSDPDTSTGNNAYTIEFSCPAVLRERAKRAEEKKAQGRLEAERLLKVAESKCPIPKYQGKLPIGKGCPKLEGGGYECLNGNAEYLSFPEAWIACAETRDCGAILKHSNSKFYLRRASDPDMTDGSPSYSIMFNCKALQGQSLKEAAQADEIEELKRELAQAKKLQRYEQCFDAGFDQASRDAKCEGDLKCARKGFDNRRFGDCAGSHCCSQELLPRYAECWYFGHDDAARDAACDGDMKCSRKGYNGRNFGDCEFKHCCSKEDGQPAKAESPVAQPAKAVVPNAQPNNAGPPNAQAQPPQNEQPPQQAPAMDTAVLQDQQNTAEVQDQAAAEATNAAEVQDQVQDQAAATFQDPFAAEIESLRAEHPEWQPVAASNGGGDDVDTPEAPEAAQDMFAVRAPVVAASASDAADTPEAPEAAQDMFAVKAVGAPEAPMAVEATEAVAAPKPAEAPAAAEPTATEAKAVDEALPASELAEVPEAAKAPTAAEEPKAAEAPQAVETPTAAEASVAAEPAQDEPTAAEQAELERAAAKEEEDTAGDEEGARAATVTPHDHEAAEEPSTDEAPEAIAPPAKRVYVAPEIAQALNMQAYNPAASAAEAPAAEETPQAAEAPAAAETPQVEQVPVAAEAPRSSDAPEAPAAAEAEVAQDDGWVVLPEAQAYDQAEAEEAELAKQAAQEEVRAMRAAAADTSQLKEEQGQGKEDEVEEESTDLDKVTAMYESTSDTDCGWGEDDPNDCQWSNQAYINGKERTKEKIDEASIMEACGVMCAKAGEQCGGFSWISARKICYFRKNAKCGVIQRTGIKCYQKKSP